MIGIYYSPFGRLRQYNASLLSGGPAPIFSLFFLRFLGRNAGPGKTQKTAGALGKHPGVKRSSACLRGSDESRCAICTENAPSQEEKSRKARRQSKKAAYKAKNAVVRFFDPRQACLPLNIHAVFPNVNPKAPRYKSINLKSQLFINFLCEKSPGKIKRRTATNG